jgi:hypothetical protein
MKRFDKRLSAMLEVAVMKRATTTLAMRMQTRPVQQVLAFGRGLQ